MKLKKLVFENRIFVGMQRCKLQTPLETAQTIIDKKFLSSLSSAIFYITRRYPHLLISAIKFVPEEYARLLEFFIHSRTHFIPYTEGFRNDFDIGKFFL